MVLDTRPYLEWSISHITGALNVAPKPGVPIALYTSDANAVGATYHAFLAASTIVPTTGKFLLSKGNCESVDAANQLY